MKGLFRQEFSAPIGFARFLNFFLPQRERKKEEKLPSHILSFSLSLKPTTLTFYFSPVSEGEEGLKEINKEERGREDAATRKRCLFEAYPSYFRYK